MSRDREDEEYWANIMRWAGERVLINKSYEMLMRFKPHLIDQKKRELIERKEIENYLSKASTEPNEDSQIPWKPPS